MIKIIKSTLVVVLLITLIVLLISNPRENSYLSAVAIEYSKNPHHDQLPSEIFQKIGKSKRANYFLFSTYSYKYSGMSLHYFGMANQVFYVGSEYDSKRSRIAKMV